MCPIKLIFIKFRSAKQTNLGLVENNQKFILKSWEGWKQEKLNERIRFGEIALRGGVDLDEFLDLVVDGQHESASGATEHVRESSLEGKVFIFQRKNHVCFIFKWENFVPWTWRRYPRSGWSWRRNPRCSCRGCPCVQTASSYDDAQCPTGKRGYQTRW